MKPFSSRVKIVVPYNRALKRFEVKEEEKDLIKEYIPIDVFFATIRQIENNKRYRPLDRKTPLCKKIIINIFCWIILLIYLYIALILLQLAIFNLILLGLLIVYFKKLYSFLSAIYYRYDQSYKNGPFKKFIEQENAYFYRA